jgi:hypothetical protein
VWQDKGIIKVYWFLIYFFRIFKPRGPEKKPVGRKRAPALLAALSAAAQFFSARGAPLC